MRTRSRWSVGLPVLTVASALTLGLLAPAADPVKRPAGLDLVPSEGTAVLTVHVAAVHDAAVTRPIRDAFAKGDQAILKRLEAEYGFGLDQVERFTILFPAGAAHPAQAPLILFTTRTPVDRAKLLKAWKATTEPPAHGFEGVAVNAPAFVQPGAGLPIPPPPVLTPFPAPAQPDQPKPDVAAKPLDPNAPFYFVGGGGSRSVLVLVDDRTVAYLPSGGIGAPVSLIAGLLRRKVDGPLAEALALADKHHLTAAVDGKSLREMLTHWRELMAFDGVEELQVDANGNIVQPPPMNAPKPADEFTPYEPLFQLDRAVLTADVGERTTVRLTAHFPTAAAAKKAEPTATASLAAVVKLLAEAGASESDKDVLPLIDFAKAGLGKAAVSVDGKTLTVAATADVGPAVAAALAVLPQKVQEAADRVRTANNLKQILLALHSYHDANGHFPQDVVDADGKAVLSWRVQLLPYLEAPQLHQRIDQSAAWDDPANKKLWDQMPDVFRVPGREANEPGHTFFQAYRAVNWVGQNDCWLVDNRKVTMADVTDGASNTVGVIETENGGNWMKPGDILFDPKKLPGIGNPKTGKAAVGLLDGSVQTIDRKKYEGEKIRPLVTVNGGENVELGGR